MMMMMVMMMMKMFKKTYNTLLLLVISLKAKLCIMPMVECRDCKLGIGP